MAVSQVVKVLWATGVLFVILPHLNLGLLSDYKICGDSECESLMSRVQAIRDHHGKDCRFLSFRRGDTIFVYHKLTGKREDLWAGSIDKQFGYFPKDAVQEEQVHATTEKVMETRESDFFCMDEFGYLIDHGYVDSDDEDDYGEKIQNEEPETTHPTPSTSDTNADSPSASEAVSTEAPGSAQETDAAATEKDQSKYASDAAAQTQEEAQENPAAPNEQGGSASSSWLGSSVTGWLGLATEEEPGNLDAKDERKETEAEASFTSSVTGWLGLGGEGKPDDAVKSREEADSLTSTMTGWLGFGGEKQADLSAEKEQDEEREHDKEQEPAETFRSRRMSLDLEGSHLHEEEKEEMGTLDWLGNGLSNTLGFGLTNQESKHVTATEGEAKETIQGEEGQPASSSWFDMGIGDMLGFGEDKRDTDESKGSDFKETEEGETLEQQSASEDVDTSLSQPAPIEEEIRTEISNELKMEEMLKDQHEPSETETVTADSNNNDKGALDSSKDSVLSEDASSLVSQHDISPQAGGEMLNSFFQMGSEEEEHANVLDDNKKETNILNVEISSEMQDIDNQMAKSVEHVVEDNNRQPGEEGIEMSDTDQGVLTQSDYNLEPDFSSEELNSKSRRQSGGKVEEDKAEDMVEERAYIPTQTDNTEEPTDMNEGTHAETDALHAEIPTIQPDDSAEQSHVSSGEEETRGAEERNESVSVEGGTLTDHSEGTHVDHSGSLAEIEAETHQGELAQEGEEGSSSEVESSHNRSTEMMPEASETEPGDGEESKEEEGPGEIEELKLEEVVGANQEVEEEKQDQVEELKEEEKQEGVKEIKEEGEQDEIEELRKEVKQEEVEGVTEEDHQEEEEELKEEEKRDEVEEIKEEKKQEEVVEPKGEEKQEEVKELQEKQQQIKEEKQEDVEELKEEERREDEESQVQSSHFEMGNDLHSSTHHQKDIDRSESESNEKETQDESRLESVLSETSTETEQRQTEEEKREEENKQQEEVEEAKDGTKEEEGEEKQEVEDVEDERRDKEEEGNPPAREDGLMRDRDGNDSVHRLSSIDEGEAEAGKQNPVADSDQILADRTAESQTVPSEGTEREEDRKQEEEKKNDEANEGEEEQGVEKNSESNLNGNEDVKSNNAYSISDLNVSGVNQKIDDTDSDLLYSGGSGQNGLPDPSLLDQMAENKEDDQLHSSKATDIDLCDDNTLCQGDKTRPEDSESGRNEISSEEKTEQMHSDHEVDAEDNTDKEEREINVKQDDVTVNEDADMQMKESDGNTAGTELKAEGEMSVSSSDPVESQAVMSEQAAPHVSQHPADSSLLSNGHNEERAEMERGGAFGLFKNALSYFSETPAPSLASNTAETSMAQDPLTPQQELDSPADSTQVYIQDLHTDSPIAVSQQQLQPSPPPPPSPSIQTSSPSPMQTLAKTLSKQYKSLLAHMSAEETTLLMELFGRHKLQFLDYVLGSSETMSDDPDGDESILLDIEGLLHYHREALVAPTIGLVDAPQEEKEKTTTLIALEKLQVLLARVRETLKTGKSDITNTNHQDTAEASKDKEIGIKSSEMGDSSVGLDDNTLRERMEQILDFVHQIAEDSATHVNAAKELLIWLTVQLSSQLVSVKSLTCQLHRLSQRVIHLFQMFKEGY